MLREKLTVDSFSISSSVAPRDARPMSWKDKGRGRPQDRFAAIGCCCWEIPVYFIACSAVEVREFVRIFQCSCWNHLFEMLVLHIILWPLP